MESTRNKVDESTKEPLDSSRDDDDDEDDIDDEEEEEEEDEPFDKNCAPPRGGRPSLAWGPGETRAAVEELRRQLEVEREAAAQAEAERDELAKELDLAQHETAARIKLIKSLEEQRDTALTRAHAAEARASKIDRDAHDARAADRAAADAHCLLADRDARSQRSQADDARAQVAALRHTVATLEARVDELDEVKMTTTFAAKVRAIIAERDDLKATLAATSKRATGKENRILHQKNHYADAAAPTDLFRDMALSLVTDPETRLGNPGAQQIISREDRQTDTCRQS